MDINARTESDNPGLLESIWRYRALVVVLTLVGGLVGLLLALQQQPIYEATARLLLADPRNAGVFGEIRATVQDSGRYIRNQAELIRTGAVYPTASGLIDGRISPSLLEEHVTVEGLNDVDLIMISAVDVTPEGAAELANAVAEAYQTVVREQIQSTAGAAIAELQETNAGMRAELRRLEAATVDAAAAEAERTAALNQIAENEGRIAQLTVDAALFDDGVEAFAPAHPPLAPARPRPVRSAAAGTLLAFAAAAGFAWWRHGVTRTLQRPSDPAAVLNAPLLGAIPDFGKVGVTGNLPTVTAPLSPAAEAFQFVVAALMFALREVEGSTIVVTSPTPGDGKTVCSVNLAVAARQDDRRVIMVDADRRMLGLTTLCGVDVQAGLSNLRSEQVPFEWATSSVELSEDLRLSLITAGYDLDDPAGYFRTPAFRRALTRVKERADVVVIDSPPLLAVSDTSAIASQADGIVLVVNRGTSERVLTEVRRRLEFVGTPVLGYIFNRARARSSVYGYAEAYGYGRGELADRGQGRERPRRGRHHRTPAPAPAATWSSDALTGPDAPR